MELLTETKDWIVRTVFCCFARPRESEQQIHICPSCRSLDDSQVEPECKHGCEGMQPGTDRPQTSGHQDKSRQPQTAPSQASKGRYGDDEPQWKHPTYPADQDSAAPIRPTSQGGKPPQPDDTTLGGHTDADDSGKGGPTTGDESSLGAPTDADEKSKQGSEMQQPRRSIPSTDAPGRQTASPTTKSQMGPGSQMQRKTSRPTDPALRRITPTPASFERRPSSPTTRPDSQSERGTADSKLETRHVSLPPTDASQGERSPARSTGRQTNPQKKTLPGDSSQHGSENVDSSPPPAKPPVRRTMPSTNTLGRQTVPSNKTLTNSKEGTPGEEDDPFQIEPEDKNKKAKRGSKASHDSSGTGRRTSSTKKKTLRGSTSPVPSPHDVQ